MATTGSSSDADRMYSKLIDEGSYESSRGPDVQHSGEEGGRFGIFIQLQGPVMEVHSKPCFIPVKKKQKRNIVYANKHSYVTTKWLCHFSLLLLFSMYLFCTC
ncbi:hypothetical protein ILYODFUR_022161 [Ilyodon furcidens]|uniref:Uncharacterized protein n=1 Tax=Ilyodon furcidens TaxID=33524 RepID=A0ABV0VGI3_9TELE